MSAMSTAESLANGEAVSMDGAVDELGDILAQLDQDPENVPLIRRQIRLMDQLGMTAELQDSVLRLSSLVMIGEGESTERWR